MRVKWVNIFKGVWMAPLAGSEHSVNWFYFYLPIYCLLFIYLHYYCLVFIKIAVHCFKSQIVLKSCLTLAKSPVVHPDHYSFLYFTFPPHPPENFYNLLSIPGVWKLHNNERWCGHFFIYCALYLRVLSIWKFTSESSLYFSCIISWTVSSLFSFFGISISLKLHLLTDPNLIQILIFLKF